MPRCVQTTRRPTFAESFNGLLRLADDTCVNQVFHANATSREEPSSESRERSRVERSTGQVLMNSTNELPDLTRPFRRRAGRALSATFVSWEMIGFKITSKEYDRYSAGTGTEIRFRTGVAIVCIGGISNLLS